MKLVPFESRSEAWKKQNDRLRTILEHATLFPPYAQLFADHGLTSIQDLSGFKLRKKHSELPILDGSFYSTLDDHALTWLDTNLAYIACTSGTTSGTPKIRHGTSIDEDHDLQLYERALRMANIQPHDRVLTYDLGDPSFYSEFSTVLDGMRVPQSMFYSARKDFDNSMFEALALEPTVLLTVPSVFTRSLDGFMDGMCKNPSVKKIVYWGEALDQRVQDMLSREYGIECYSFYGTTELGWIGMECDAHDGIHIFNDTVLPSLISPEWASNSLFRNGSALEARVAFTTLIQEGKPAIKYGVGDVIQYTAQRCECGSVSPRMAFVAREKDNLSFFGCKITYNDLYNVVYTGNQRGFMNIRIEETEVNDETTLYLTFVLPMWMDHKHDKTLSALRDSANFTELTLHKMLELNIEYSHFQGRKVPHVTDLRVKK